MFLIFNYSCSLSLFEYKKGFADRMDRNDVMSFDGGEADEIVHGFISDCKWLIAVGIVLAMGRVIVYKEDAPLRVCERKRLVCCYRPVCYVGCWVLAKPLAVFVSVLGRDYSSTWARLLQYLHQVLRRKYFTLFLIFY